MSARPLALVVEDSEDQADLLRVYLTREGFDVFTARNAEAAIAAFDDIRPVLAVIDLRLPGVSGEECAHRVRERFPECLVVISSVLDLVEYPDADAALPKPVRAAELREILARLRG